LVDVTGSLNEHQIKRLHMIIKPFMLRRVKKDVEMEMADKIEVEVGFIITSLLASLLAPISLHYNLPSSLH